MAHIVEFRSGTARDALEAEPGVQGSAEIIIFPGVRRERHAEPPAEGPRRRNGAAPQRDVIELPD